MGTRDQRIDAYIAKAQPFAKPILEHLRSLVHQASPAVVEDVKWGMPFFLHRGRILCHMAAFQAHAAFGIARAARVLGAGKNNRAAMGNFGRITRVRDLPAKRTLIGYLKAAIALEATPNAPGRRPKKATPTPRLPADLARALKSDAALLERWKSFAPGQRREYVSWLTEAKRPETRARRLATTIAQVSEGKSRNWRYMVKRSG